MWDVPIPVLGKSKVMSPFCPIRKVPIFAHYSIILRSRSKICANYILLPHINHIDTEFVHGIKDYLHHFKGYIILTYGTLLSARYLGLALLQKLLSNQEYVFLLLQPPGKLTTVEVSEDHKANQNFPFVVI